MTKKIEYEIFHFDDADYKTVISNKFKNRKKWEEPNVKLVKSFIPGTILEIFVKKNQEVKEGEELLLLEAMKMKNKVVAPISGKIKSINVKKTQIVPKNFLLIEFQ